MVTGADIIDSGDADAMDTAVAMTRENAGGEGRARGAADWGVLRCSEVLLRVLQSLGGSMPSIPLFRIVAAAAQPRKYRRRHAHAASLPPSCTSTVTRLKK